MLKVDFLVLLHNVFTQMYIFSCVSLYIAYVEENKITLCYYNPQTVIFYTKMQTLCKNRGTRPFSVNYPG